MKTIDDKKHRVKKSDMWTVVTTINRIHSQLNNEYTADEEQITMMANAMFHFLKEWFELRKEAYEPIRDLRKNTKVGTLKVGEEISEEAGK